MLPLHQAHVWSTSRLDVHVWGRAFTHHYVRSYPQFSGLLLPLPSSFQRALLFFVGLIDRAHISRALPDLWLRRQGLEPASAGL